MRLVVPHFGPRPTYFPLVVRSMAANPDVSWLLLTEQPVPDAPPNVAVQLCEFEALAKRIQSHFEFEISLERPYKLCDFRPAFGEIFADELTGYDFWGHSDLDLVFGRIRRHLPAAAFEADKILFNGNFSLYRNTAETAGWYRHEVGKVSYRGRHDEPDSHALRRASRHLLHRRGPGGRPPGTTAGAEPPGAPDQHEWRDTAAFTSGFKSLAERSVLTQARP